MMRRRGFSLLEALLAVVVLGVGLVGLSEAVTLSLASSREAEEVTVASFLASGRLELLRSRAFLSAGESDGSFGDDFPRYRWRETVAATDLEGLYEATVDVLLEPAARTDGAGDSEAASAKVVCSLETLLFDPPLLLEDESADARSAPGPGQNRRPAGGR